MRPNGGGEGGEQQEQEYQWCRRNEGTEEVAEREVEEGEGGKP